MIEESESCKILIFLKGDTSHDVYDDKVPDKCILIRRK